MGETACHKQSDGNGNNGTDENVGGAPCPPGQRPVSECPDRGTDRSGGDTTASTDDACVYCDDDCPPCDSEGKGECCSQIASGFASVTGALHEIRSVLSDKLGSGKKSVDDTFDELLEKLREKFETGSKTCDECKTMLRNGLGGTLEYAVVCAGACIDQAAAECSMGSPESWGKPCEGCGEPCCKCVGGICEPEPCPEEDKPRKWIAWCSPATGSVAVTREGGSPPGTGFYQVGMAESESAAAAIAAENCEKQSDVRPPVDRPESRQPINVPNALCDFDKFISGEGSERITRTNAVTNMAAGWAESYGKILALGMDGINVGSAVGIAEGFIRAATGAPPIWQTELLPIAIASLGCSDSVFTQGLNMLSSIEGIGKLSGVDLTPWTDQIKYVVNARCRQQFMTPDQALAAYLANAIDYRKLDGHWAINNVCNESLNSVLEAARAKPVPIQLAMMRRRKMIDAGGYAAGMRRLGYLESGTAEDLFKLTEQVPTLTDITRLMVRDADDESLVSKFGLDTQFEQKYGGQLREWSEFQGIPEKFAKYYWRAHWSIPAPGQLFTFYQRLRDNPQFGGREKVLDDIKAALIQQDILPYWHEHFLAVSFRPISRVDIRRMFNIGSLTEDEVTAAYRQLGSSDENADKLTKFAVSLRRSAAAGDYAVKLWHKFAIDRTEAKRRMVANGLPDDVANQALSDSQPAFASSPTASAFVRGDLTRQQFTDRLETVGVESVAAAKIADQLALKITNHSAIKGVLAGVIEPSDAKQRMLEFGMSEQIIDNLLSETEETINYAFAAACQKGIKRRYLMGEFGQQEAINKLLSNGATTTRATRLAESWDCEKSSAGKAVPTARLCDWLGSGVISSIDFAARLVRLGHTEIDAARIRDDCLASVSLKRQAQATKEAKEQATLEEREQNALRKAAAAAQREGAQTARLSQQAKDKKRNRETQLMSAASKASKKCDCELGVVVQAVRDGHSMLQREYGFNVDESLATLIKAAEAWDGGDIATYADTIIILALGLTTPAESTPA